MEIYNCSQIDTFKAALRWENNPNGHSSVTNSVIHSGLAWGINVKSSMNILIQHNIIWGFRPIGVGIQSAQNITFDNNIVGHVVDRTTFAGQGIVDYAGAVSVCSYPGGMSGCKNIEITNNIAGSSVYCGFCTHGHNCGDTNQKVLRNNTAHSIKGELSGHGLVVGKQIGNQAHDECLEASSFVGYKNYYMGATSWSKTNKVIFSGMTMLDNFYGFGPNIVPGSNGEYGEHTMQVQDNIIIGETLSPDCPQDGEGGFCF